MQINIVKIGNSRGIRIPKRVLDQCHVESAVELTVSDDTIVLTPILRAPREGWAEAAKLCHAQGDDHPMIADVLDDDMDWSW
ncbi:MAG: AbrB/MazE/SpoVT family DNA-binding domain-containing protein [Mariprofundaceae bacterium]